MKDWIRKIEEDTPLTPAEQEQVDRALAAQEASGLSGLVSALPQVEAPASIVDNVEKNVRRRGRMRFASGVAACAAASFAMFFALNAQQPVEVAKEAPSADTLYDWHNEAVATSVLPSDGASLATFSVVAGNGDGK